MLSHKPFSILTNPYIGERPQGTRSLIAHDSNSQHAQLQPATMTTTTTTTTQPTSPKRNRSCEMDTTDLPVQKQQRQDEHTEDAPTNLDAHKEPWPQNSESEGNTSHILARKRSTWTLSQKSSTPSINSTPTQSDQQPREAKSAQYRDARYKTILEAKNTLLDECKLGIRGETKRLYRDLLETEQTVPNDSLFGDDLFEETCKMVRKRNQTQLIHDIKLLIVPSAEMLAIRHSQHLKILMETVNEGWDNSIYPHLHAHNRTTL